jgi:phage terminase small subunit
MADETPKLTKKQQVFVNEYLSCFNGAEAARRAGYSESRARVTASELLADSNISEQIKARLAEVHMGADEALSLQSSIARGDVSKYLNTFGGIDIDKVKEDGRLIKKIKTRTITKIGKTDKDEDTEIIDTELELYPADVAQERILKIHGKIKDPSVMVFNVKLTDE